MNKYSAKGSVYLVFARSYTDALRRFSLHLAESVVREIQKTERSVIVLFYLRLVASVRFTLVYLYVQFVFFCGQPSFLGKMNKYINRSMV